MADDLCLLLQTVILKPLSRHETVAIPTERMAPKRQENASLMLPDMGQFVNEQPLPGERCGGEIVAIGLPAGMEMQMPAWGHHHLAGLEGEPLAPPDADCIIIDRTAEDRPGKGDLARRQRPFTARRASMVLLRQRASPAARTSAVKLALSPLAKVSVTSVEVPGVSVSDSSIAIT